MKLCHSIVLGIPLLSAQAIATDFAVKLNIPQLNVAEYHRPYVAIWLERSDQSFIGNVAVWYDFKLKDNEGTKWLKVFPDDGQGGRRHTHRQHVIGGTGPQQPPGTRPHGLPGVPGVRSYRHCATVPRKAILKRQHSEDVYR